MFAWSACELLDIPIDVRPINLTAAPLEGSDATTETQRPGVRHAYAMAAADTATWRSIAHLLLTMPDLAALDDLPMLWVLTITALLRELGIPLPLTAAALFVGARAASYYPALGHPVNRT
jgi:hypothetical protein